MADLALEGEGGGMSPIEIVSSDAELDEIEPGGELPDGLPVLPLRDMVTYPGTLTPLAVGYLGWLQATGAGTFTTHGGWHVAALVSAGVVTAVPLLLFNSAARRPPLPRPRAPSAERAGQDRRLAPQRLSGLLRRGFGGPVAGTGDGVVPHRQAEVGELLGDRRREGSLEVPL